MYSSPQSSKSSLCKPPGTVGINIPKMLQLFKIGHEYLVESDCYIRTQIATVRLNKLLLNTWSVIVKAHSDAWEGVALVSKSS